MKIVYCGKELELQVVNLNQLSDLEDKFGSVTELTNGKPLPMKLVRYLAYLHIKQQMPEVTEEEVGKNLDMSCITEIVKTIDVPKPQVGGDRPLP